MKCFEDHVFNFRSSSSSSSSGAAVVAAAAAAAADADVVPEAEPQI